MNRIFEVEAALRWVYREELPKDRRERLPGPALARPGWVEAAEIWAAKCGAMNRYGVAPDFAAWGGPHPAAVALHELVGAVDEFVVDFEGWSAFDDWRPAGDGDEARAYDAASAAGLSRPPRPSLLLRRAAVLGPPVGWDGVRPEWRETTKPDGGRRWYRLARIAVDWTGDGEACGWETVEVDGWDARSRRPQRDAYTKWRLTPDPVAVAEARAEWQIWRAALDVVCEMADAAVFAGGVMLADLGLMLRPSCRPWRPWAEAADPARVLEDVSAREAPALRLASPSATGQTK